MGFSIQLENWQVYLGLAITGTFIGLGNALGKWIFEYQILAKYKQIKKKLTK